MAKSSADTQTPSLSGSIPALAMRERDRAGEAQLKSYATSLREFLATSRPP